MGMAESRLLLLLARRSAQEQTPSATSSSLPFSSSPSPRGAAGCGPGECSPCQCRTTMHPPLPSPVVPCGRHPPTRHATNLSQAAACKPRRQVKDKGDQPFLLPRAKRQTGQSDWWNQRSVHDNELIHERLLEVLITNCDEFAPITAVRAPIFISIEKRPQNGNPRAPAQIRPLGASSLGTRRS